MKVSWGDRLCHRCRGSGCNYCCSTGLEIGRVLRDSGMEKAAQAEIPWTHKARNWIASRSKGSEFTADDLTSEVGNPEHRAAVGAVFSAAAKAGLIRRSGLEQSGIPTSHASVIQRWERV